MRRLLPLLLVLLLLGGCKAELHRGLSEGEANEIVAVLLRAGIPATRAPEKAGTLAVSVDESRFADAVEEKLRAGRVSATTIAETMNLMNKAVGVLNGAAAAGKSVASDLMTATSKVVDAATAAASRVWISRCSAA